MIAVAATTDWDSFASFSNYGTQTVNLSGPGVTILSTLPGSTFGYSSGTSMAAPMVSGVAALVAREKPTLTPYQMRSLIYSGLNSLSILGSKVSTSGRLNANNAVVAAKAASVDTSQPAWSSSMYRAPSSSSSASDSAGVAPGGCGLVKILSESGRGGEPPAAMRNTTFFAVLLILLAPVLLGVALRSRSKGRDKRRFERYQIESRVSLKVGDRELLGSISSISLGGVQVNTDAWLENGGIVTMNIASPDGKETIQVQGKVVWSEEHKHYGVQFADAQRSVLDKITDWTRGLIRAA